MDLVTNGLMKRYESVIRKLSTKRDEEVRSCLVYDLLTSRTRGTRS